MKKTLIILLAMLFFCMPFFSHNAYCTVIKEKEKTFLVDRTGAKWDITQAISIGFKPAAFQFGLGRDVIKPLDDSDLGKASPDMSPTLRVIGISEKKISKAYSVSRLSRHEVANSSIGSSPIAAAY